MWLRNLPGAPPATAVTPGGGSSGFTAGSVIFADSAGALNQDNAAFFWDATNDRLGIGLAAPLSPLHVAGTISPAANANGYVTQLGGTIVEAGSGTHAMLASVAILAPTITAGTAATTRAASLYIPSAPTGGTTNWGADINGDLNIGGTVDGNIFLSRSNGTVVQAVYLSAANYLNIGSLTATSNVLRLYGAGGDVSVPSNNFFCGGAIEIDGVFNHDGSSFGALNAAPVVQQTSGANLTNNVTAGGVNDTIADYTDLAVYATDAAAIRNNIYQLARKLKQVNDGLRLFGFFT